MDANNFVGAQGNGYVVYVGGQQVGNYSNLNDAQNAFNSAQSAAASSAGSGAGGGGGGGGGSMQAILDAIASGDTQQFNEAVRQYNDTLTNNDYQFSTDTALKQQEDYANLADKLLTTAASLRGPQDYFQYDQYLNGGKNLFQQLYGNQPAAAFGGYSGPTPQPATIQSLMQSLGFSQAPQMPNSFYNASNNSLTQLPTPGTGQSTIYNPNTPAPAPAAATGTPAAGAAPAPIPTFDKGGPVKGRPGQHILAILKVGERVIPTNDSDSASQANGAGNYRGLRGPLYHIGGIPVFDAGGVVGADPTPTATPAATPATPAATNTGNVSMEPVKAPSTTYWGTPTGDASKAFTPSWMNPPQTPTSDPTQPNANGQQPVPLPHQINPAVFNSLGPTGLALLQSAVTAAGWDWNDYLSQYQKSLPEGNAPAYSVMSWYTPGAARASTEGYAGAY